LRESGYELTTFQEQSSKQGSAVLTFDDSTESQFRILPDGNIDPYSAVGILERYKWQHPEWPVTATFFVNTTTESGKQPFEQEGLAKRKLEYLVNNGYEIGSHGARHKNYKKLSYKEVQNDLNEFKEKIRGYLPNYEVKSFAYPFGSIPEKKIQELVSTNYPYTAHAWGGLAKGERNLTPRIETGPETVLASYTRQNVYKQRAFREAHARSDPQLQAQQAQADHQPDDNRRGWSGQQREGREASGPDSQLEHREAAAEGRSSFSPWEFWRLASSIRDRYAWTVSGAARYAPIAFIPLLIPFLLPMIVPRRHSLYAERPYEVLTPR
ncbi:polysaccharide deacetylase family protein, partial [Candidatus Woesearchaeota archaeon]|nr:polysaccharide deacetylase family protein [Candidatus Woesearchaeota archaeon]